MADRMKGGAGPSSVDAQAMSQMLLKFGKDSQVLREEMASWVESLGNDSPPWAAYWALMACRLVALNKQPGVRSLGIGEVWRRGLAKCILVCCGEDAKAAFGSTNLCAGLEAGIEGALHAVSARAALANTLDFGEWEIDDDLFSLTAGEGEVQDSLPTRRAREARMAAVNAADSTPSAG